MDLVADPADRRRPGSGGVSALCLAGGGVVAKFAVATFTLAWVHTIEKIPWEEDWRVEPDRLVLTESRIKGSGAGMEPPPEARLEGGFYRWAPENPDRPEVILRRSPADNVGDWSLCLEDRCREIGDILPPDADPVRLYPCPSGP